MGLLHVASSHLNSSVVFAITRLFSRWFQSMAVLMNKEFLYCSVLECSTTTAHVLFLTCEFTMFVVSQSWNVLVLMCRLGFWWLIYYIQEEESLLSALQPLCKRISVAGVVSWFVTFVNFPIY